MRERRATRCKRAGCVSDGRLSSVAHASGSLVVLTPPHHRTTPQFIENGYNYWTNGGYLIALESAQMPASRGLGFEGAIVFLSVVIVAGGARAWYLVESAD